MNMNTGLLNAAPASSTARGRAELARAALDRAALDRAGTVIQVCTEGLISFQVCSSVLLFVYTASLSVHSSITACAHCNAHFEHTVSTLEDPVYTSFNCCLTKCAQYVGRPVHTWSKCAMSTLVHTWDQVCTGKPANAE